MERMTAERALYEDPAALELSRKRAIADIEAGRVVPNEVVVDWLETWGTIDETPMTIDETMARIHRTLDRIMIVTTIALVEAILWLGLEIYQAFGR